MLPLKAVDRSGFAYSDGTAGDDWIELLVEEYGVFSRGFNFTRLDAGVTDYVPVLRFATMATRLCYR